MKGGGEEGGGERESWGERDPEAGNVALKGFEETLEEVRWGPLSVWVSEGQKGEGIGR